MGILTVGLLGVAALFPVGGFYMQKAEISDRGSAIAQSVMNDVVSRGMLNTQSWMVIVPNPTSTTAGLWNTRFSVDGKYSQPPFTPATFTRPFGAALSKALTNPQVANDHTIIARQFGAAFVIDPLGTAAMAMRNDHNNQRNPVAKSFPAGMNQYANWNAASMYSTAWQAWGSPGNSWPIRRVTFQQTDGWQLDAINADHIFRSGDDITTDFPPRADRPASQNWEMIDVPSIGRTPVARNSKGDYSWIVCVVPTTYAALEGMARGPESYSYDVSVVVFYKRLLPAALPNSTLEMATVSSVYERPVKAKVISTGLNGGELVLERFSGPDVNIPTSPYEGLKTGEWIMICGPHPNSNVDTSTTPPRGEPRFVMNWYQVLAVDGKDKRLNSQGSEYPPPPAGDPERRVVTLRGPQWPWQPSANSNDLSNNICATICRGAVAVHRKTLRLENPRTSAMSLVVPPGVDPPYVGVQ